LVHIHSGELWSTAVQFLRRTDENFTKVRAIGDKFNPCTEGAIKAGAEWEPFNDTMDLARMIYAHNIVLARSSRSDVVLALSPFRKKF
jgi:hypothetical protein